MTAESTTSLMSAIVLTLGMASPAATAGHAPPETKRMDVVEEIHGVKVADPYRWLEQEEDPQVVAWLEHQDRYARQHLDHCPYRDALDTRFRELLQATQASRPGVYKNRYLFSKREGAQNHAIVYVREGSHKAPAKPVIDPNRWSPDGTVALDWLQPTPDASLIAYGKSASGSEKSTLYVLDVASGEHLPDVIPFTRYSSIAWDPDMKGFLYTRYPEPGAVAEGDENYYRKLYHHRLGDSWRDDRLVVGDLVQKEEILNVSATSDDRFVMLSRTVDWARNDLYFRPLGSDEPFRTITKGLDGQINGDTYKDKLFLLTNVGAPRYRIVVTAIANPTPEHWQDLIPQQSGVIKDLHISGDRLFVTMMRDVHSALKIYDLNGKLQGDIPLPTLGTVGSLSGEPDGDEVFFSFQSFAYPPSNFRYDIPAGRLELIEQMDVKADLDAIETRQVWYKSKDGTKVPMFIVCNKHLKLNGENPTVLYGYGGFDISLEPYFDRSIIPWVDAGGVYAVANIRGGGEFGKAWHEAGRLEKKQNVFDDFIGAAEALIAMKYTNQKRLGILGGSNGGLLVGACMVQRPELFQAVVCEVPLLDMIRYHNFAIARLWIPEYGSAEGPEQFKWLYAYSPYHHVKKGVDYPATLLGTGASDSRVQPMHAFKMAAALQNATSGDRPILLRVERKAGHGQGKPLSKRIEEQTDTWSFLMTQLGAGPK